MDMMEQTASQMGMKTTEKAMQTADDLMQALLNMLAAKTNKKSQKEALTDLAEYVQKGGHLNVVEISPEAYSEFEQRAKLNNLTFYAATNTDTRTVNVVFKNDHYPIVKRISDDLAKRGVRLVADPQISFAQLVDRYPDGNFFYYAVKDLSCLDNVDYTNTRSNANFAILGRQDNTYMIMFEESDLEQLQQWNVIPYNANVKAATDKTSLTEIKAQVERVKKQQEKEKEKTKEKGRTM